MAFFFGDGFDLYAAVIDATLNYWDPISTNPNSSTLVAGRFVGSRAWATNTSTTLVKASNVNDAVHHFVVVFETTNFSGSSLGFYMELFDSTTAQCSVVFRNDGAILLTSGGPGGTVLATYTGAFNAQNVWYAFEIEVVINNTTGSIAVRKNGNTSNDFFLGSLNTRNSSNNYANKIQLGAFAISSHVIDDFLWRSDASSVPWVGDIRCYTRMPTSDASIQFSRTSTPNNQLAYAPIGIGNIYSANNAVYILFTAGYSGSITGVIINCNVSGGGGTGHMKAALFADASNVIGTLLATSSEVTNPTAAMITLTFPSPAHVTVGQKFWLGINQDANISYNVINSSSIPVTAISITGLTYASWPASAPGGTISTFNVFSPTIVYSPTVNAEVVGELQQDAASSYVFSSTNGQSDLYGLSSIGVTPASIVGVTTRGLFTKSDAGTRNATVQLKSGGTTVQGVNTPLNTTWGWIARNDLVDPATGVAWSPIAVGNVNIGPVVTA